MASGSPAFEALTRQFYEWEVRGRGWRVFDAPVGIEPPFQPFFGHFVTVPPGTRVDDGHRPTLLSSFIDGIFKPAPRPEVVASEEVEPEPAYVNDDSRLVEIQAVLPPETKITKD